MSSSWPSVPDAKIILQKKIEFWISGMPRKHFFLSSPLFWHFLHLPPLPLLFCFSFAGHLLGFNLVEEVFGKAFLRILGLDFSVHHIVIVFSLFYGLFDSNILILAWFERFLLLHKLDVKLSLPIKTDDITISKTRDVDLQRCLVTGSSGANGLKMKGFRWNSWDCNTTWYPLFNGLLLFTVGLSIIQLRFDCMTIFLC